ncbi:T9SS type A sorting domain-containing protein [bacterium]|nr:T9SS type A sorting domain-containing protein [bacterium]
MITAGVLLIGISFLWANEVYLELGGQATLQHVESDFSKISFKYRGTDISWQEVRVEGSDFTDISIQQSSFNTVVGDPRLPVLRKWVKLPFDADISIRISDMMETEYHLSDLGIENPVVPYLGPLKKIPGYSPPLVQNPDFYQGNQNYYRHPVSIISSGTLRNQPLALIEVRPLNYNPGSQTISVIRGMTIELQLNRTKKFNSTGSQSRYMLPYYSQLVNNNVVNPEAYTYSWVPPLEIGYLIVAGDEYVDSLWELVAWKIRKGFKVELKAVSELGGTEDNIRDYIIDQYESGDVAPAFVLLVGDVDAVPAFRGPSSRSESDLPYSLTDDRDYLPDIMVGRLSLVNSGQVAEFCRRIVNYERFNWTSSSWANAACFAASDDWMHWFVAEGTHRYVIQNWLGPIGMTCDSIWAHSGGSGADITTALNAGRTILNYSGHGYEHGWAGPDYDAGDIAGLSNSEEYPFVISNACLTGTYSEDECFMESWIRQEQKGAIASLGASNSSYWDEDDVMERAMFDAIFEDNYFLLAGMIQQGLLAVNSSYPGSGEYYFDMYNLMGDPSLAIWLGIPEPIEVIHPERIPCICSIVEINAAIENALVCITNDRDIHVAGYTGPAGVAELEIPASTPGDSLILTVTHYNKFPYYGRLLVGSELPWMIFAGFEADDDISGISFGDGDGVIDAGETIELNITLFNVGMLGAEGVTGVLQVSDELVTLIDSIGSYGNIAPEDSMPSAERYILYFSPRIPDRYSVNCSLRVTDAEDSLWMVRVPLTVRAPRLEVFGFRIDDSPPLGDGDGYPEGGETLELTLDIQNQGGETARNMQSILKTMDPEYIVITANNSDYGDILPANINTSLSNYQISILEHCPRTYMARFIIHLFDPDSIFCFSDTFTIEIKQGGFDDDMEGSIVGWEAVNWHLTEFRHASPTHSWYCGEEMLYQYPETLNAYLYSPLVTTPDSAVFSFWHYHAVEPVRDTCQVKLRLAGGGWRTFGTFSGFSHGWVYQSYDLSLYPRETSTQFMFVFKSSITGQNEGWYIDDIYIGPPRIAEAGGASVNPLAGSPGTEFEFKVNYRSNDGLEPIIAYVVIDDINYSMNTDDTDFRGGAEYYYRVTLPEGTHDYYFYFEVSDNIVRFPRQGEIPGPYVSHPIERFAVGESESGITSTGGRNDWEWGIQTSGPESVPFGENCWATNLEGNYRPNSRSRLVLPDLNLSGLNHPLLQIWQWYSTETSEGDTFHDGGNIKISVDGGDPFVIFPVRGYDGQQTSFNLFIPWQPGFGGDSYGAEWHPITIDLKRFIGETVTIYLDFGASPENEGPGWYINDIALFDPPASFIEPLTGSNQILPGRFLMADNFPNPFNSSTTIRLVIPGQKDQKQLTNMSIYDINGKKTNTLLDEPRLPGIYYMKWDGKSDRGRILESGIYFLKIRYGCSESYSKIIILK